MGNRPSWCVHSGSAAKSLKEKRSHVEMDKCDPGSPVHVEPKANRSHLQPQVNMR